MLWSFYWLWGERKNYYLLILSCFVFLIFDRWAITYYITGGGTMEEITKYMIKEIFREYINKAFEDVHFRSLYHIVTPYPTSSWLLFHPYSLGLYEIEDDIEGEILKLCEVYTPQKVSRILDIPEGKVSEVISEYNEFLCSLKPKSYVTPIPNTLWLIVSKTCQLRCRYCYVGSGKSYDSEELFMKPNLAVSAVDKILQIMPTIESVDFFGGEPTLNMKTIVEVTKFIKKNYPDIKLNICTNGYNLSEKTIKFFSENDFTVTVSLDGNRIQNDINRKSITDESTFERIIKSIHLLHKYGVTMSIQATYSFDNVLLGHDMRAILDYLSSLSSKGVVMFKVMEIFETLKNDQTNDYAKVLKYHLSNMISDYIRYFLGKLAREKCGVYDAGLIVALTRIINNSLSLFPCALTSSITVLPDGKVQACHMLNNPENQIGDIRNITPAEVMDKYKRMANLVFVPEIDYKTFWYYPLQEICPAALGGIDVLYNPTTSAKAKDAIQLWEYYWDVFLSEYHKVVSNYEKSTNLVKNLLKVTSK